MELGSPDAVSTSLLSPDRARKSPPSADGRSKRSILEALGRFHYLTAEQLARLLFSPRSVTYVYEHSRWLCEEGFLRRVPLPRVSAMGSSKNVYALDRKGYRFLEALGCAPEGRFRPAEEAVREQLFLEHTLACNDVLILAHRLARQDAGVVVAEMRTERELRRSAGRVEVYDPESGKRERIAVIPDGWLELHVDGSYKATFALEMDRSTMEKKALRRKLRGLVRRYANEPVTVVVVALGGEKRQGELVGWVEGVLDETNARHHADLFRVAAFDPAQADPREAFLSPIWRQPFSSGGHPLLERA